VPGIVSLVPALVPVSGADVVEGSFEVAVEVEVADVDVGVDVVGPSVVAGLVALDVVPSSSSPMVGASEKQPAITAAKHHPNLDARIRISISLQCAR
jgi:hypothetical protein